MQGGSAVARDQGRLVQLAGLQLKDRSGAQAAWEKLASSELLCIDSRLRSRQQSVSELIDRGIGPDDGSVADAVGACRPAASAANATTPAMTNPGTAAKPDAVTTPAFDCNVASMPDEKTICATPELAQLDRMVVAAYDQVEASKGERRAKRISGPLLRRRHACGNDAECIKRVQLAAIAAFQERGATVQPPGDAPGPRPDRASYAVNGLQLGGNVGVGSPAYRVYACAPNPQVNNLTGCVQRSGQSRRRRSADSMALLHTSDGTIVYIDRRLTNIRINERDAEDEIADLSQGFGNPTRLSLSGEQGAPKGSIAYWGAVTLQPVAPARRDALMAGTDSRPEILLDGLGDVQRSLALGLPVYELGGGPGYVWAASWGRRGRGIVRMIAVDATQISSAATAAPAAAPPGDPRAKADAPQQAAPAPASASTPPAPAQPAQPSAPGNAAPAAASSTPAAAAAPAVRVVGPPIELKPSAPVPPRAEAKAQSRSWLWPLVLMAALLAVSVYLFRKSRAAAPSAPTDGGGSATAPVAPDAPVRAPAGDKIDLVALVPAEPPGETPRASSRPEMSIDRPPASQGALRSG